MRYWILNMGVNFVPRTNLFNVFNHSFGWYIFIYSIRCAFGVSTWTICHKCFTIIIELMNAICGVVKWNTNNNHKVPNIIHKMCNVYNDAFDVFIYSFKSICILQDESKNKKTPIVRVLCGDRIGCHRHKYRTRTAHS